MRPEHEHAANLAGEGWVVHQRREPLLHRFRYPVWMVLLDVDALDGIDDTWLFSSGRRWAPLAIRPGDYPRDPQSTRYGHRRELEGDRKSGANGAGRPGIRTGINARLMREGLEPADQVRLLTQPRSWGWLFNPVSFYFCYREQRLVAVVAEITNTPWNEVHSYVLPAAGRGNGEWEFAFPKDFHVSPFVPMDVDYRWRFKLTGDAVEIAMHLLREGRECFFAGVYLRTRPLSRAALARGAFRYPLQNLATLARIYWQAFRLWRRRAPFHPHPRKKPATAQEAQSS